MNDNTCLYICDYHEWKDYMEGYFVIPETQTQINWPLFSNECKKNYLTNNCWSDQWDNHIIYPFNEKGAKNYFADKGFENIIFITKIIHQENNQFTNQLTKGEK